MTTELGVGDFAKVINLKNSPHLNGRHVEILKGLETVTVPEEDGVQREGARYGIAFITSPEMTGYMKPENLEPVDMSGYPEPAIRRAIWIHETGMEGPDA